MATHVSADEPPGPGERVPKNVTKSGQRSPRPRTAPTRQPIDPDTVRVERSTDFGSTGTWRVVPGSAQTPTLVGFVRRRGPGKRWEARTPVVGDRPGRAVAQSTGHARASGAQPPGHDRQAHEQAPRPLRGKSSCGGGRSGACGAPWGLTCPRTVVRTIHPPAPARCRLLKPGCAVRAAVPAVQCGSCSGHLGGTAR